MTRSRSNNIRVSKKTAVAISVALVAIILIAAITFCIIYFAFPNVWDELVELVFGKQLAQGEGVLQVYFIDVGQGDCIYIEFPDGDDMLIDCGSSRGSSEDKALAEIDRFNDDNVINHLMLTHTDSDHVSYLDAVIEEYEVKNIYMPYVRAESSKEQYNLQLNALDPAKLEMFDDPDVVSSDVYAEFFIAALSEPNCNIYLNVDKNEYTNSVVIIDEDDLYRLTFYCPTQDYYAKTKLNTAERINAVSPVGILEYNGRKIVFTGDSNSKNEPIVSERLGYIDCDVLKVAHHGSETSSLDVFLDAVNCEYAIISCGGGYGHPTEATLNRLVARDMIIYRTDNNGTVTLTVDEKGNINFAVTTEVSQKQNQTPPKS